MANIAKRRKYNLFNPDYGYSMFGELMDKGFPTIQDVNIEKATDTEIAKPVMNTAIAKGDQSSLGSILSQMQKLLYESPYNFPAGTPTVEVLKGSEGNKFAFPIGKEDTTPLGGYNITPLAQRLSPDVLAEVVTRLTAAPAAAEISARPEMAMAGIAGGKFREDQKLLPIFLEKEKYSRLGELITARDLAQRSNASRDELAAFQSGIDKILGTVRKPKVPGTEPNLNISAPDSTRSFTPPSIAKPIKKGYLTPEEEAYQQGYGSVFGNIGRGIGRMGGGLWNIATPKRYPGYGY